MNNLEKDLNRSMSYFESENDFENFKKALEIAEDLFAKKGYLFSAYDTSTHYLFLAFDRRIYIGGLYEIKISKSDYKMSFLHLPDKENFKLLKEGKKIFGKIEKDDFNKLNDMPEECEQFEIRNNLKKQEQLNLLYGFKARSTDDRWSYYANVVDPYFGNCQLFLHRSWTGDCIYIVEFTDKKLKVTVNRNKNQYACDNIKEDKKFIKRFLHQFGRSIYNEV